VREDEGSRNDGGNVVLGLFSHTLVSLSLAGSLGPVPAADLVAQPSPPAAVATCPRYTIGEAEPDPERLEAGIEACLAEHRRNPRDVRVRVVLADHLLSADRAAEAGTYIREAADAGDPDALYLMAHVLRAAQGDAGMSYQPAKDALAAARRAADLGHVPAMLMVGRLLDFLSLEGEHEAFRRALAAARAQPGRYPNTLLWAAVPVADEAGRSAPTEAAFLEAAQPLIELARNGNPDARNHLGGAVYLWTSRTEESRLEDARSYDEAIEILRRVHAFHAKIFGEGSVEAADELNRIAWLLRQAGRPFEAEPLYRQVIEARRGSGGGGLSTATAIDNLGYTLNEQGRYEEAQPIFAQARALRVQLFGEDPDIPEAAYLLATSDNNIAQNLDFLRSHADAEPLHRAALERLRRAASEDDQGTAWSENNLGMNLVWQGRAAEALPLLEHALAVRQSGGPMLLVAASHQSLGEALMQLGRYEEAAANFAEANRIRTEALGGLHLDTIAARRLIAAALMKLPGRSEEALAAARAAVDALRQRQAASSSDASEFRSYVQREATLRESALTLADALWAGRGDGAAGGESEALVLLQEATTTATTRSVALAAARRSSGSALAELARQRQDLETEWLAVDAALSAGAAGGEQAPQIAPDILQARKAEIEAEMRTIDAHLQSEFPQYFALVRPTPVTADQARALPGPDEAVVIVLPSQMGTHVLAVTREGLAWERSAWTDRQVNVTVQRLLSQLGVALYLGESQEYSENLRVDADAPFDRAAAYQLYQQVFAPVRRHVQGKRHVFVVAGGALSSLPFGVLVTEQPGGSDKDPAALRATKWLADEFALLTLPSLQSLQFIRATAPAPNAGGGAARLVGFGNPVLDGPKIDREQLCPTLGRASGGRSYRRLTRTDGGGEADIASLRALCQLPGTETELNNLRAELQSPGTRLFLGADATEPQFRKFEFKNVQVLALATHGLLAWSLPNVREPGLVFTPPDEADDSSNDGLLTPSEIASLDIPVDFVILSACNTAAGDGTEGSEALSGLARAFFYSGARNLLVSHWPVRDDVASELTVRMIRELRGRPGISPAAALQAAMGSIRGDAKHPDWAHPRAWAPFSLVGDSRRPAGF